MIQASVSANKRPSYRRKPALVLLNGLAEQAETWFCNADVWRQDFDVHMPNLISYRGAALHRRIEDGNAVDVRYLVEKLESYIDDYVQVDQIYLVANSMGGKVAIEYAASRPDRVMRLALLCPSGMAASERLPIVEGVRRNDIEALVGSVFSDATALEPGVLEYYRHRFVDRRWRTGLLRTVRGTMDYVARERLRDVQCPTLILVGDKDRIVDPNETIRAFDSLSQGRLVVLPGCGHAPQIERAEFVNRLVCGFLLHNPNRADQTPMDAAIAER